MRRIGSIILAAALLALPGAALGQGLGQPEGGAEEAERGEIIAAIEQSRDKAKEIEELDEVSEVELIVVDTLAGDETSRAIENAVSLNEYDVRNLQNTLQKRDSVSSHLETQGVETRNIVGARVDSDRVVVFVRKQ